MLRRGAIWVLLWAAMGAAVAGSSASPARAAKPAVSVRPGVGGPHARFVVSFRAVAGRHGFCRGVFHGPVTIVLVPVCPRPPTRARPTIVCPMFVVDGGVVGRFSFRVR